MSLFLEVVRLIQNGEPVRASTANRASSQIDQNVRRLAALFDAAMMGETLIARDRTVAASVLPGQPVYFNGVTQQFEQALAVVEITSDGQFRTADSAQVWGIALEKQTSTKADILLCGVAEIDLSQSVVGTPETGVYYLSHSVAGRLQPERPPVGVTVLQVAGPGEDGKYVCYVNTKFNDLLEAHRHYKFDLVCEPAGDHTPPSIGERHEITGANSTIEGWLPADHPTFDGNAPAGAAFGYNIAASPFSSVWPPTPIGGAYLEWNRGEDAAALGMGVPLGQDQLCVIDRNGIWWMSDCYGDVPWPTDFVAESVGDAEPVSIECPRELSMLMTLWFSKPVFSSTGTWVSSLRAATGSGLSITCVDDGDAATTGHLLIDFDLALTIDGDDTAGHLAIKDVVDGKLKRGPIVESISVSGAQATLSSDVDPVEGKYYGNVQLTVDLSLTGQELSVESIRLIGAEEEHFENTFGIGFPAGRDAAIRGLIRIPAGVSLPAGIQLKLRFWVLNRSASNVPADIFAATYRRIGTPSGSVALPTSAAEVTLGTYPAATVTVASANRYFVLETDPFDVAAGEDVLFTLFREGSQDGYSGDLQVLRQRGVYVPA